MSQQRAQGHGDLASAAVSAAVQTVSESGVEGLTLRGIAARVGVTHPALYRYFRDRPALLTAVAEQCHADLGKVLARSLSKGDDDPVVRVRTLARTFARWAAQHPEFFDVMAARATHPERSDVRPASVPAGVAPGCPCAGCGNVALLIGEIVRGQRLGVFVQGPPQELGVVLWSFVMGYVLAQLQGRGAYAGSSVGGMLRHMDACLTRVLRGIRCDAD